ncbi:MAG: HDIG domain-containing protein [Candidatus Aenigmarchaeota archaeon]|nr:HDIG domain-containing protein [Candidatus Aenigmarchaeota archaeon]
MSHKIEQAKRLMRLKLLNQPHVISHVELVTKKAIKIGKFLKKRGFNVDMELLEMGGYLHDIGRNVTHGVGHGVESARILRESGFSGPLIRLVERHVGAGITAEEAKKLGLPEKDYLPETLEEKILAYADKFFESEIIFKTVNGEQIVERRDIEHDSIEPTLNRFKKLFGLRSPVVLRLERLRDEMEKYLKQPF